MRTPAAILALSMLTVGCVETRVIEQRGVVTLRDLQPGGLRPVKQDQSSQSGGFESVLMTEELPGQPVEDDPLRRLMPDSTVRLYAFSPRHLIQHLRDTLENEETELIDEYLISNEVKELYKAEGRDPQQISRYMVRHAPQIQRLLKLLPLGENTPGATFQDIGRNRFRLAPLGADMLELRYTAIQMTIEERQFRLLMLE